MSENFSQPPNWYLDAIPRYRVPPAMRSVLDVIVRYQWGFPNGRIACTLTDGGIGERCGMPRQNVNREKQKLIEAGFIYRNKEDDGWCINRPRHWKIKPSKSIGNLQKGRAKKTTPVSVSETPYNENLSVSVSETPPVSVSETQTVSVSETHKDKEKDKDLKIKRSASADRQSTPGNEGEKLETENPQTPVKKSRAKPLAKFTDEQLEEIRLTLNRELPEMSAWRVLNTSRVKRIKTFWPLADKIAMQLDGKPFDLEALVKYLRYVRENCQWMFERRPRGDGSFWQPRDFEYLLTEDCYTEVREGKKGNW